MTLLRDARLTPYSLHPHQLSLTLDRKASGPFQPPTHNPLPRNLREPFVLEYLNPKTSQQNEGDIEMLEEGLVRMGSMLQCTFGEVRPAHLLHRQGPVIPLLEPYSPDLCETRARN